jgi:hypothetical protein
MMAELPFFHRGGYLGVPRVVLSEADDMVLSRDGKMAFGDAGIPSNSRGK